MRNQTSLYWEPTHLPVCTDWKHTSFSVGQCSDFVTEPRMVFHCSLQRRCFIGVLHKSAALPKATFYIQADTLRGLRLPMSSCVYQEELVPPVIRGLEDIRRSRWSSSTWRRAGAGAEERPSPAAAAASNGPFSRSRFSPPPSSSPWLWKCWACWAAWSSFQKPWCSGPEQRDTSLSDVSLLQSEQRFRLINLVGMSFCVHLIL